MARNAPDNPAELSNRTKLDTLKRTFAEFKDDNVTDWAAALTYYGVLALFPAIIALISIAGLVVSPSTLTRVLTDTISQVGPQTAVETFRGPVETVAGNAATAGFGLVFGLAGALWAASGYVGAFMRASNAVYEREEGRPFYKLRPIQLLVTLVLVIMAALVVISLVVSGPIAQSLGDAVGLGSTAVTIWQIAKWPVMLLFVMLMLAILYWSSPNVKQPGFKWISPGSAIAVLIWIVASALFAFYVANFGSYNKTYGSLAGVVVFLVWLWITNIAVLLGQEINAEVERSREIEAGVPDADEDIQAPYRQKPKGEEPRNDRAREGAKSS